jgi:hypothetical protein
VRKFIARNALIFLMVMVAGAAARVQAKPQPNVYVMLQTSVPDFVGSINDPGFQDVEPG